MFVVWCFLKIIKISLEYIVYDPNYNYDDEHGDDNMETDDDEDAEYVSCLLLGSVHHCHLGCKVNFFS